MALGQFQRFRIFFLCAMDKIVFLFCLLEVIIDLLTSNLFSLSKNICMKSRWQNFKEKKGN